MVVARLFLTTAKDPPLLKTTASASYALAGALATITRWRVSWQLGRPPVSVPTGRPKLVVRLYLDARYQSFPNGFAEHHPNGLNINSPNNSDVTSHDSAIDLNDDHQYTSTRPGLAKPLGTRYTKNETHIRSVRLTSPTIGRLKRSTKVTSEEIKSRGATPERFRQSLSRLQPTVEDAPDEDEIAAVNLIGSDDLTTNIIGIDWAQPGIQIPSSE
ncbi:hypothetical protein N7530_010763 [Penicillium desertorum]|uniref:Uncharacterized protein n=1 Tax=Penicillium desertorum TaxID=1303715 RepID=A0A9W9WG58_9EURO|nr:hypothetical protein N7530_010763 [Penicillium desertorum]